ncbi:hypothetical protein KJZ61_01885 [Candidatus Dependentiae bacterium]|nr:hypothetical protein [Candidatus Dependentiae bacterium]
MQKRIMALAGIIYLTLSTSLLCEQSSQEDSVQRRFIYMCIPHGMIFCVGTTLLQETLSPRHPKALLTRMIALPIALTFMHVGARPFMSGTAYVRDIDAGRRANPFSWEGLKQEGLTSAKTAQELLVKISKKLSEFASRMQKDDSE